MKTSTIVAHLWGRVYAHKICSLRGILQDGNPRRWRAGEEGLPGTSILKNFYESKLTISFNVGIEKHLSFSMSQSMQLKLFS